MPMERSLHCPVWFQDARCRNSSVLLTKDTWIIFSILFYFLVIHSLKVAAKTSGIIFIFKIGRLGKVEFELFTLPRMEKNNPVELQEIFL